MIAYHLIQEAANGKKSIKMILDDTDVLIILAHHLYFRTNGLPDDIGLTMKSCTSSTSVISVGEVKHTGIIIMP